MQTYTDILSELFPELPVQLNYPLKNQTYFKIGGPADAYLEISKADNLHQVLDLCHKNTIPITVIGGASNIIVSDKGIRGLVIKLINKDFTVTEDDNPSTIRVGAGMPTALLVRQAIDHGLQGLEYFLGVPGTVGGAIYNNAHYLTDLIGEHVKRVQIISHDHQQHWLTQEEAQFGYDSSRFQSTDEIIFAVEFSLMRGNKEASLQKIAQATTYRAQTQPLGEPSSGCIFQNVPVTPELAQTFPEYSGKKYIGGGFLIDRAGLKGSKVGQIEVSQKHAAFFINHGQGRAQDVLTLINQVKKKVHDMYNVELQEEVFFLGER